MIPCGVSVVVNPGIKLFEHFQVVVGQFVKQIKRPRRQREEERQVLDVPRTESRALIGGCRTFGDYRAG